MLRMRLLIAIAVLAIICTQSLVDSKQAVRVGYQNSYNSLWIRGGAKKSKSGKKVGKSSRTFIDDDNNDDDGSYEDSKRRNRGDHDDVDDDDDDDDERKYSKSTTSKSKTSGNNKKWGKKSNAYRGKGKKGKKGGRMDLMQWVDPRNPKGLGSSVSAVKEKLEVFAKQGQTAYKDVYRRAKVLRSSAFEGMLLRATWPGDEPVPRDLLDEIIKHSIPAFKYGRSSAEDDPYHMTMHKLWTKMCENDWRTVTKSLYILHCISRESSADSCQRFSMAIKSMSRTRNPKNPDHRYFDTSLISELDEPSSLYVEFVNNYAQYVLLRSKVFSGKFEEIKEISETTQEKQVVARLKKAQQCIAKALKIFVQEKEQYNIITGHAIRLTANDIKDMWTQFSAKILPFVDSTVTQYGGTKADENDIIALLKFYQETDKEVKAYYTKATKAYSVLRLKFPVAEAEPTIASDKVENKITELSSALKVQGGYSPLWIQGGAKGSKNGKKVNRKEDDDDSGDDSGDDVEEDEGSDEDEGSEEDEGSDEDEGSEDNEGSDDEDGSEEDEGSDDEGDDDDDEGSDDEGDDDDDDDNDD